MVEFAIAFAAAVALLAGALIALRKGRFRDMPSQEVIDRVKAREQEIEARERSDRDSAQP